MAANALLTSLKNDVVALTNRPDLDAAITMAVKAATLKLHNSDHYYKDLVETGVSFASLLQVQQLDYTALFPLWRNLKYIRKAVLDSSTGTYVGGDFLAVIEPEMAVDGYGVNRDDVAYATRDFIQIRCNTAQDKFIVGYYANPELSDESYSSWIARSVPYAIVYDAAATVFKSIGYDEQAALMRQDSAVWARELTISAITA